MPAVIYKDLHCAALARNKVAKVLLCDLFLEIAFFQAMLKGLDGNPALFQVCFITFSGFCAVSCTDIFFHMFV